MWNKTLQNNRTLAWNLSFYQNGQYQSYTREQLDELLSMLCYKYAYATHELWTTVLQEDYDRLIAAIQQQKLLLDEILSRQVVSVVDIGDMPSWFYISEEVHYRGESKRLSINLGIHHPELSKVYHIVISSGDSHIRFLVCDRRYHLSSRDYSLKNIKILYISHIKATIQGVGIGSVLRNTVYRIAQCNSCDIVCGDSDVDNPRLMQHKHKHWFQFHKNFSYKTLTTVWEDYMQDVLPLMK